LWQVNVTHASGGYAGLAFTGNLPVPYRPHT
jgi:hypothetical protein